MRDDSGVNRIELVANVIVGMGNTGGGDDEKGKKDAFSLNGKPCGEVRV